MCHIEEQNKGRFTLTLHLTIILLLKDLAYLLYIQEVHHQFKHVQYTSIFNIFIFLWLHRLRH